MPDPVLGTEDVKVMVFPLRELTALTGKTDIMLETAVE